MTEMIRLAGLYHGHSTLYMFNLNRKIDTNRHTCIKISYKYLNSKGPVIFTEIGDWPVAIIDGEFWFTTQGYD